MSCRTGIFQMSSTSFILKQLMQKKRIHLLFRTYITCVFCIWLHSWTSEFISWSSQCNWTTAQCQWANTCKHWNTGSERRLSTVCCLKLEWSCWHFWISVGVTIRHARFYNVNVNRGNVWRTPISTGNMKTTIPGKVEK